MCAGEFVEVYGGAPGAWDAVVTCFFLDTAPNACVYIETINAILKPGGYWINLGGRGARQGCLLCRGWGRV
jgi:carnosine N-methyltransferase